MEREGEPLHHYRARVERLLDGCTFEATVDLGFHLALRHRFRLLDYHTPDLHSSDAEESERGRLSLAHLHEKIPVGSVIEVLPDRGHSFGIWRCDVLFTPDPKLPAFVFDLTDELVTTGWGVRWDGNGDPPAPWRQRGGVYPDPEWSR